MKKLVSLFSILTFIFFPTFFSNAQIRTPATLTQSAPIPVKVYKKHRAVSRSHLAENTGWCFSQQDENLPEFKHYTKIEEDHHRLEYIQRKNDKKPILFYQHDRSITFTLGHKKSLVLINDSMASKGNQVMISDLNTGQIQQIDKKMTADYFNQLFPKNQSTASIPTPNRDRYEVGFWILPIAMGFSPDDRKVLIHMEGADFTLSSDPQEEKRLKSLYQDWFYVVDPMNGYILKIHKTGNPPTEWWKF